MPPRPLPSRLRLTLTAMSAAVGGVLAWHHWRGPWLATLAILTGALLLLALVWPRGYAPVFRVLDGAVHFLLQAITWLLLGAVFLVVFVPGRLVLAVRGRDPLESRTSGWRETRKPSDIARHFRAQF